jgi:drug/metabolite transporter (DMT)-like permease
VPVIAALGGAALLGEAITLRLVLASVAVLGGIALVLARRWRPAVPSPAGGTGRG